MPSVEEVGRRLKAVRKELGMTLKEVAEASGMSPTHISEIERGKTSPTVGALRKIAGALGKETAFFVENKPLPRISIVKKEDRETVLLPGIEDAFVTARALTTGIPAGLVSVVLTDEEVAFLESSDARRFAGPLEDTLEALEERSPEEVKEWVNAMQQVTAVLRYDEGTDSPNIPFTNSGERPAQLT